MSNVNANVNITVNTQQAIAQLRMLTAEINTFNKQSFASNSAAAKKQREINQALVDGVRVNGQFKTSIVPISSAVDRFSDSLEKNKLSLGQYTRYAASQLPGMRKTFTREFDMINRVAQDRVKRLNTQFVMLGQSANGAQQALSMMPNSLDQFAAKSAIALQRQQIFNRLLRDGSTQLLNWGKNTQWAGRQLMVGFTIPLGILGAQAAKVFKELEAEAINFKKVYGDMFTTGAEVEQNLSAIKELSVEMTKYGQSAKQTMQLANTAAQSGARGAELMAATTQATRLAILGQMEQSQAIETTISLQTAFSMSNEKLAESINFLNSVENQTILSLQDISEAIPRVASVIKGFGGDVQDLSVLLVAMKEGGVSASEGANALKNSMARIISPTKQALEVSAKYGIALQDIVSRNDGKIVPLFQELATVLDSLGGQPRQEVLSAVFGKFQYARIGTLLSNIARDGSQAAKAIELTGMAASDLATSAEKELGTVENSISTKFTASLEKAKISLAAVGEEFLKALTPVLDIVGRVLSKFDELPGGIKTAIVAATAIIGGLAPVLLMVVGLMANAIANIGKFILFLRKQVGILKGNGEAFKFYARQELDAAAAAQSLEGRTSSLTQTMLLQKPAIESLITLYGRLAVSARTAATMMPTTMGGGAAAGAIGKTGFAAVVPKLPILRRNSGGPIFESSGGKTRVPGSGNTDTVPAMLTPGEFVINKKATKENLPLIQAINGGSGFGGFNKGGKISGAQYFNNGGEAKRQLAHLDEDLPMPKGALRDFSGLKTTRGAKAKSAFVASYPSWVNQDSRKGSLNKSKFINYLRNESSRNDYKLLFDSMGVPELERAFLTKRINNKIIKDLMVSKKEFISDRGGQKSIKFSSVGRSFSAATPKKYKEYLNKIKSTVAEVRELRENGRGTDRRFRKNTNLPVVQEMARVAKKKIPRLIRTPRGMLFLNKGGMIPGIQYLMGGGRAAALQGMRSKPDFLSPRPSSQPASPQATEFARKRQQSEGYKEKFPNRDDDNYVYHGGNFEAGMLPLPPKSVGMTQNLFGVGQPYSTRNPQLGASYMGKQTDTIVDQERFLYKFPLSRKDQKEKFLDVDRTFDASDSQLAEIMLKFEQNLQKSFGSKVKMKKIIPSFRKNDPPTIGRLRNDMVANATNQFSRGKVAKAEKEYERLYKKFEKKHSSDDESFIDTPQGRADLLALEAAKVKIHSSALDERYLAEIAWLEAVTASGLSGIQHKGGLRVGMGKNQPHDVMIWYKTPGNIQYANSGGMIKNVSKYAKGGMIPGFNMGGMVAKKVSDLRSYLSARHGATAKRNWVDPLNSGEMRSGAIYGPGIYQSNMAGRGREYSGLADLRLAVNKDGFVYRNPRDPMSIAKVLRGKGYISLDEVKARGLGTDVASYKQLRAEGYKGVTVPQGNGEVWTVDFSSRMKLANSKTPFGLKQAKTDLKQLRSVRQSEKRYDKANASKRNADDDLTLNRGGFIGNDKSRIVPGTGSRDTVPAMLTPGEFVINKNSTQKNLPLINAINSGRNPVGLNAGGKVPGMQYFAKGDRVSQSSNTNKTGLLKQIMGMDNPRSRAAFERQYLLASIGGRAADKAINEPGYRNPAYGHFSSVDKRKPENWRLGGKGSPGMPMSPAENQLQESMRSSARNRKMFERYLKQELSVNPKDTQKIMRKLENNQMLSAKEMAIQSKVVTKMIDEVKSGAIKQADRGAGTVSKNLLRTMQGADASYRARESARARLAAMNPEYRSKVMSRYMSMKAASGGIDTNPKMVSPVPQEKKVTTKKEKRALKQSYKRSQIASKPATNAQQLAREIKKTNPGLTSKQALAEARTQLGQTAPTSQSENKKPMSRMARASAGIGKFGMSTGMAVSMGAMLPMMNQDEQGKFMGVDSGTAMMGIMGAGTLLSVAPMLGAAAAPILGVAAAAGALAIGFKIWRGAVDDAAKKSAELGAELGGAANAAGNMAKILGVEDLQSQRNRMRLSVAPDQQEEVSKYAASFESESGKAFIKSLQSLTGAEKFKKVADYLRTAIASGMMDTDNAQAFAKSVGVVLNDPSLANNLVSNIKKEGTSYGSDAMLALAKKREEEVLKNGRIKNVLDSTTKDSVNSADAAMAISSGTQIIKSYQDALAVAEQQQREGSITFQEYMDVVKATASATSDWTDTINKARSNTDDAGATAQGSIRAMDLAGVSEQQQSALQDSYSELWKQAGLTSAGASSTGAMETFTTSDGKSVKLGTEAAYKTLEEKAVQAGYDANIQGVRAYASETNISDVERKTRDAAITDAAKLGELQSTVTTDDSLLFATQDLAAATGDTASAVATMGAIFKDTDALQAFVNTGGDMSASLAALNANIDLASQGIPESIQNMYTKTVESLPDAQKADYAAYISGATNKGGAIKAFDSVGAGMGRSGQLEMQTEFLNTGNILNNFVSEEVLKRLRSSDAYKGMLNKTKSEKAYKSGPKGRKISEETADSSDIRALNTQMERAKGLGASETILSFAIRAVDQSKPGSNINLTDYLSGMLTTIETFDKNIPKEFQIAIGLDTQDAKQMSDLSGQEGKLISIYETIGMMSEGEQQIAARVALSIVDGKNVVISPEDLVKQIDDVTKAIKNLSSKNINVEKEAILTIMQSFKNNDGELITAETAQQYYDEWISDKDIGQKKVSALNEIDLQTLINLETSITGKEETLSNLKAALGIAYGSGNMQLAESIEDQIKIIEQELVGAEGAKQIIFDRAGNTASGPSGGKGGSDSPLKSFVKGILDQVKMWTDASATVKTLNNVKKSFTEQVLKGQGIFDKLKNVKGISGSTLKEIIGMGPKGANEFIKKYVKDGKLVQAGKNVLRANLAAGARSTIETNLIEAGIRNDQRDAAKVAIKSNASQEAVSAIGGSPELSAQLLEYEKDIKNNAKGARKAKKGFIESIEVAIESEKKLSEAIDPIGTKIKKITEDNDKIIKSLDKQIDVQQKIVDSIQEEIDKLEEKNDLDQWTIRNKTREKDLLDRQIEALDRLNELDQRRAENLKRQDDIRNRASESISHDLDIMSQTEDKINKSYEKRVEALDKVADINNQILQQEKQKLGLAQALSEGDIYAATAAAQEMRQSQAEFAQNQLKAGIEQSRDSAIAGLRTSEGLTREEAENRINQIKEQSYQTSLLIRDIEDSIYQRNKDMIPLKDQQYVIDEAIRVISDRMFERETQIRDIRIQQLDPAEKLLSNLNDQKIDQQNITDETINQIEALADQELGVNEVTKRVDELAKAWREVQKQIAQANKTASQKLTEIGPTKPKKMAGESSQEFAARAEAWKAKKAAIDEARQSSVDASIATGESSLGMYMGGKVRDYSYGGKVIGNGSRDSVSTRLTPGEFVIRKSMVDKYGMPMLSALNQGSFSMPRYNVNKPEGATKIQSNNSTNISAPMYNSYNVGVNVSNTGASADEIANITISKIKQMQNTQIRSGRGY